MREITGFAPIGHAMSPSSKEDEELQNIQGELNAVTEELRRALSYSCDIVDHLNALRRRLDELAKRLAAISPTNNGHKSDR